MNALLLLVLASLVSAQERSSLSVAAQFARNGGDCASIVPFEHLRSIPLPVVTTKGLRYRMMFYRAAAPDGRRSGAGLEVFAPTVVAEFDGNGGDVTCKVRLALPTSRKSPLGPLQTNQTAGMNWEAYQEREEKLYAAIERAAAIFETGKRDLQLRDEVIALFFQHREPGLADFYPKLAPDFWRWLDVP